MNKIETKKLFWKIVNELENCCDTLIKDNNNEVIEKGISLTNGYCAVVDQKDGVIRIYNDRDIPVMAFTEESESLVPIKKLFESLEL